MWKRAIYSICIAHALGGLLQSRTDEMGIFTVVAFTATPPLPSSCSSSSGSATQVTLHPNPTRLSWQPSRHVSLRQLKVSNNNSCKDSSCNRTSVSNDNESEQTRTQTQKLPPHQMFLFQRREVLNQSLGVMATSTLAATTIPKEAEAAPPIAIIAEELGYFPVTNKQGETVYVSAKVKRSSSEQSIELAKYLRQMGAVMYGAFWCPHCQHQKELFGKEAWSYIKYVECSPKGYGYDSKLLASKDIDGFPTWFFGGSNNESGSYSFEKRNKGITMSGEMPLEKIVTISGFPGAFDASLEEPDLSQSVGSCR